MCSKGGGTPPVPSAASTTFNSTTQPAASVSPLYTDFLNRANALSNTPFNTAQLGSVAPMNTQQTQAGNELFRQGMDMGNFDPAKVRAIESPFIQDVVNTTQGWFNNQNAIQGNDLLSQAIKSGNAFGGDRAGVAEGIMAGQQQLAQAPVIAGLYQSGYTQALDEYNKLKQFGLQGAGAALGWGGLQQQQSQKELDVAQQNAMMQSAYPFQTLNWYGSTLGGIGPLLGQTAFGSNNPPEQSGLAAGLGVGSAAVGLGSALAGGIGGGGAGQKRGGIVKRRARGGLVPVLIRHNGGIIPGLAYGGSSEFDDTSSEDDRSEARDSKQRDYVDTPTEATTPQNTQGARRISVPNIYGQLKLGPHTTPQPVFPNTSGSTQPQQSTTQQIGSALDLGTKALSFGSKLAPLLFDDGGGVPHLANGGDDDLVMSDASDDPVEAGQQYARDYAGRTTWFNPRNEQGGYTYTDERGQNWTDTGAQRLREGKHASGLPSTTPGFATPGSADLGNWFQVTGPDGRRAYAQKTDIGPAGVVDLNAPLAARMYGRPNAIASGVTQVRDLGRDRPAGAGGTQWPDPSKGNTGELPSAEQPSTPGWQVPGTQQGRAAATEGGAAAGPGTGVGPVGTRIPGIPERSFAQRLAGNPFWQLGTALMAKPGIKGREFSAIGSAAQSMSAQQIAQRKEDILEHKPEMLNTSNGIMFRYPDGSIVPTGLKSERAGETEYERRTQKPFAIERETPGSFGSTQKTKEYYSYDEHGNVVPWQGTSPAQAAPSGRQDVVTPDQQPSLPPPQAPQRQPAAPQQGPQQPQPQLRQTEQQPPPPQPTGSLAGDLQRSPEERIAAGEAAAGAKWAKDPATGIIRGPDGATYDDSGKQLTPPTTQPATPQIAQQGSQPAAGPTAAGPNETLKRVEDQWANGAVKQGGAITNPGALNRNEAALQGLKPDEQRIVKGVADYALDPNKVFNAKNRTDGMNKVMEYDPNYNAGQYAHRNAARKAFEATGLEARNIQSQDMALQHADRALSNIDALGHTRLPALNEWLATAGKQTGLTGDPYQKAVARVEMDVHAVSNELMKVFRGGTGQPSEKEAKRIADKLNTYDNPEALKEALREGVELLYGRIHATAYRYNDAMGPAYARPTESWLSPEGRDAARRILQAR